MRSLASVYQGIALAGRGAGARRGDWELRVVDSGDLPDDGWLETDGLRLVGFVRNSRTERYLLRPFDVLVTSRAGSVRVALVPPGVSRTVASATLLVARSPHPETGMGHWLWYFLTSSHGKAQLARRLTTGTAITFLSAANLGEVDVPVPSARELDALARIVEASEAAHAATMHAARLRRDVLRDALVADVINRASLGA
ncbi:MAG: hypothetical protein F4X74_13130 [Acidimicrobiia bacterium]|nr:hypothetical protein [Acidimicrobiia bacterium]